MKFWVPKSWIKHTKIEWNNISQRKKQKQKTLYESCQMKVTTTNLCAIWTKICPKIMDVVVRKWMIICWAQTKFGGKQMETRWERIIMHAKHCRNGWIKDKGGENFLWSNFYFILFYFRGDLLILWDGRINFESVRVDSWLLFCVKCFFETIHLRLVGISLKFYLYSFVIISLWRRRGLGKMCVCVCVCVCVC
jgi:hypothetical protein